VDLVYVDSAGLGELVEAYVAITGSGGRLVLAGVTRRFRLLLTTVGLLSVLEVYDDEGQGLDRLRSARPGAGRTALSGPVSSGPASSGPASAGPGSRSSASTGTDRGDPELAPSWRCQGAVLLSVSA
jgi:hypothetical protein